jgi:hypothetical protein
VEGYEFVASLSLAAGIILLAGVDAGIMVTGKSVEGITALYYGSGSSSSF